MVCAVWPTMHNDVFHLHQLLVNECIARATALPRRADGIQMHGKIVSVSFDLDGSHYRQGKGLQVFVNGRLAKSSPTMAKLELHL